MSYVIQNFYECSKGINITPRFKFLIILINLENFFFFIKSNTFLFFTEKINIISISFFLIFSKYFYSKQYLKLLYKLDLSLVSNYTNNVMKSTIFHIFINIDKLLKKKKTYFHWNLIGNKFLYNPYFCSLKILNIKLKNKFFTNIFFFLLLIWPFFWYQHHSFTKFYLNFLFFTHDLKLFQFLGSYFLKIYNY